MFYTRFFPVSCCEPLSRCVLIKLAVQSMLKCGYQTAAEAKQKAVPSFKGMSSVKSIIVQLMLKCGYQTAADAKHTSVLY